MYGAYRDRKRIFQGKSKRNIIENFDKQFFKNLFLIILIFLLLFFASFCVLWGI